MFVFYPGTQVFQNKFLPRLENTYNTFLTYALNGKRPGYFLLGTIGLLIFSIMLTVIFQPKVEFFPENQPNYANVFVSHPIGTDIKVTNKTVLEVEDEVNTILADLIADTVGKEKDELMIQSIISQVGEGASDPSQGVSMGNTPHKGRVTISFAEFQFRNGIETGNIVKNFCLKLVL